MPRELSGDPYAIEHVLTAGARVSESIKELEEHLDGAFIETLTGARHGAVYTTFFFTNKAGKVVPWGSRPPHQASAPGEAPAFDTGDLLRGLTVKGEETPEGATVTVESRAPYSVFLEKGTSKMLPRPFMMPTVMREIPAMETIVYEGIVKREEDAARAEGGKG